jgi:DNA-binding Lrp family transcriptional regulator
MPGLDDTDRRILELLAEDARRSYRGIADDVALSPPAVSDRVDRLRDEGVLEGFTIRLDRDRLTGRDPLLVEVRVPHGRTRELADALAAEEAVEAVLAAADGRILAVARPRVEAGAWARDVLGSADVDDLEVTPVSSLDWSPAAPASALARACDECGNTVTDEGRTATVGGRTHAFCCASCEDRFRSRYEELAQDA